MTPASGATLGEVLAEDAVLLPLAGGGGVGAEVHVLTVAGDNGLTRGAVRQIDRARRAAVLLAAGGPPADAVTTFGYVDEPHLARALRRYVGRTAGELRAGAGGAIALDPAQRVTS